jgi:hypothetical protein
MYSGTLDASRVIFYLSLAHTGWGLHAPVPGGPWISASSVARNAKPTAESCEWFKPRFIATNPSPPSSPPLPSSASVQRCKSCES